MAGDRPRQVFKTWLEAQTPAFRDGIEIVAMDGFTGFKTAAAEEIPDAAAVMDPFHVVALAGDALERCRPRTPGNVHQPLTQRITDLAGRGHAPHETRKATHSSTIPAPPAGTRKRHE
jgi:transposase